ncbi:MAG: class I SAM-dependent methyltransferase [Tepidanaerobacteraceae bacterium]|nr:class I SAM-dependent methyltransferase [Tepidanaerobacteraceae bacterium]
MKINLNNRLLAVANMIPKGHVVADIGTDHAYLPIYLIQEGISPRVIATEIKQGPYKRALITVRKAGLKDFIEVRLGSGLKVLEAGEAGIAVLAGMGGETISSIIREARPVADSMEFMVLQPMQNLPNLRKNLYDMGYKIIDEDVAIEGSKYYVVMAVCCQIPEPFDDIDITVGPVIRRKKTPEVLAYIRRKIEVIEGLIESMKTINTAPGQKALAKHEGELEMWKEVLK